MGIMHMFGGKASKPEGKDALTDFKVKDIDGNDFNFSQYRGKVVMVVNVASKCGYTADSYAGFKELHEKYPELVIVGFPCNQFLGQESDTCVNIKLFAKSKGFQGALMDKVEVNGKNAIDVYDFLKAKSGEPGPIKWNFTKFLVGKDGQTVKRFGTKTPIIPDMIADIERLLAEPAPAAPAPVEQGAIA
mmetsp:Transcript_9893/g.29736  ORF Transcript_9893/g.29736 Transcript_9893/m.29736 type:complete len:189 (+) Transcript_9893:167-733(+)